MMNVYRTNTVGNLLLLQTFHPMLSQSTLKLAVMISSNLGSQSVTATEGGGQTAYRVSKAALNMIGLLYVKDELVKKTGVKVILIHPGYFFLFFWFFTGIFEFLGWVGFTNEQQVQIEIEEGTVGILSIIERASALQIKSIFGLPFQFYSSLEVTNQAESFQEMVETLEKENVVFVQHDGKIMNW
jgi:NAD(P)-dependent dehydrogenase (short-subunit alcohol dehydrogenase family)